MTAPNHETTMEPHDDHFARPDVPRPPLAPLPTHRWALNRATLGAPVDRVVAGWSLTRLWGAYPDRVQQLYGDLSGTHVEVGARTPRFLLHALDAAQGAVQRVHLVEPDPVAAARAARRVRRHSADATVHRVDPRGPWPLPEGAADSVACTLRLHALPGPGYEAKLGVLKAAARALKPGGRFFGCAVTGRADPESAPTPRGARARDLYNRTGLFSNDHDVARELRHLLGFACSPHARVQVHTEGALVLWKVTR